MYRPFTAALATALSVALLAPLGTAHTTASVAGGQYFVTVGHQDEQLTTYSKTNIDVIVRANASGQRGGEIPGANATLRITLIAPTGAERALSLRPQSGAVGRYTATQPYILTEPGQYWARVEGTINGTVVEPARLKVGNPVPDFQEHTFPERGDLGDLEKRIADLEGRQAESLGGETARAPGIALVTIFLAGLVALTALRRRNH